MINTVKGNMQRARSKKYPFSQARRLATEIV